MRFSAATGGYACRAVVAVAILVLAMAATWTANACSCAAPASPADALDRSSAAFVGQVIDIDKPFLDNLGLTSSGLHDVTFQVLRSWKGVSSDSIVVRTRLSGEACGYRFEIDQKYLVFTAGNPDLLTGLCTGTRPAEGAEADLEALDKLTVPSNN
ncbi:MAG: hypothetical protein ACREEE_11730 [Dongiaceae bacterium]